MNDVMKTPYPETGFAAAGVSSTRHVLSGLFRRFARF
jgi:hypothetical protein